MTGRVLVIVAAVAASTVFFCAGILGVITGSGATAACGPLDATVSPVPGAGGWDGRQATNAAIIVRVGARIGVPYRGWVIAVATGMQESGLRNLHGGDRDSLGLFQQRPSQGWGTPAQILNPAHAATSFYDALQQVPGWRHLPVTVAAQQVQHSAYPDAYAKWADDAAGLVAAVVSEFPRAMLVDGEQCASSCPSVVSTDEGSSAVSGCAGEGGVVLARASRWLTAWRDGGPVPYLSSADSASWFDGYRRDCSGYVSMALGLSGPGLTAAGLAARSVPVAKKTLQAGDLLINPGRGPAGHVVIFDRWANAARTAYLGYEQSVDGGTHHRVIPYPYFGRYRLRPFRYAGTVVSH